jgi:DNA invertase Pin-like site-specific DNA recombinase
MEDTIQIKKCLLYTRVSTDEQVREGLSLSVQEKVCSKWARDNGYQVAGVYTDAGKSATTVKGRYGLADLIIHCQKEHIDAVVVLDTDRLARNPFDHYSIKAELKKTKTEIKSASQPMIDDSPEGNLVDGIMANVNAFQSELTSRKVKKTQDEKCQIGDYPGWAPLGYINVNIGTVDKPHRVVEADPMKGPLIAEIFKLYSTGNYSVDALGDLMYNKGLRSKNNKRVYRSILYNTLKNPFFIGMFNYKGQLFKGNQPPLTTTGIYDACQKILQIHNQNACRRRKYRWLLNGFAYCATCGTRMFAEFHHKKTIAYYHCNKKGCKEHYLEMNKLEKMVEKEFKKIQFSKEFTQRIINKARELVKKSRANIEDEIQGLRNVILQLENKRNLLEDALLDQTIDKDAFKRKHDDLEIQIRTLQNQIQDIENNNRIDIDVVSEIMKMASNIYESYRIGNFDAKRLYQSIFFETFQIRSGKIVKAIPTPLFACLIEQGYCRVSTNLLARWYDYRTTDWATELEYPEFTTKEVNKFLQI